MDNKITIKELADKLKIDKKRVSYQVSKLDAELVTKLDGKIYLSNLAISIIKERLGVEKNGKKTENSDALLVDFSHKLDTQKDVIIENLNTENQFLKEQISDLNSMNKGLNNLLDQQQQLQLKTQQLLEEKTKLLDLAQQKKWWQFWK